MTLENFVKQYAGGVDYDGAYGKQCVDYVNEYAKVVLGIPDAFYAQGIQYAYQVFTNYENLPRVKPHFTRVVNGKTNYPQRGDVVIWSKERNGKAGHIAVVLKATEHTLTVAEQNYDGKGSVRTYTYPNYNFVLGWLTPKHKNKPALKVGQIIKLKKGAKLYHSNGSGSGVMTFKEFTNFNSSAEAVLKPGSMLVVKDIETNPNGNVWVKTKYGGWICVYDYKGDNSKI